MKLLMNRFIKFFILTCLILVATKSRATNYFAVVNGDWGVASTWSLTPGGAGGAGIPGVGDIAITNGRMVGLNPFYGNIIVDRITVTNSVANSLFYNDPFFFFVPVILTINLSLSSTGTPSAQIIENSSFIEIVIAGTGSNVINSWSVASPINTIAFTSGGTTTLNANLAISGNMSVSSGSTVSVGSSNFISSSGSGVITVASGATLDIQGAVNGGAASSNFNTVTNNGTINVGLSGYLNSSTFNINASSLLNVTNNQPGGWWHSTSPGPTSVPINTTSTINYNRIGDQGVFSGTYGNLNMLNGSGTKTLGSSGSLVVLGDLNIGGSSTFDTSGNANAIDIRGDIDNDGVWAPTQLINLNGGTTQSIGGNTDISFIGGVNISGSSTIQVASPQDIDVNGMLDIGSSSSFSPNGRQVNLAGNLVIGGTLTASGTFVFDGSTTVSGSGSAAFNNVTINNSSILSAPSQTATIAGNFTNNGIFSNVNGTITFNGNNAQSISGSSTNNFYDLAITNTGATISNNATTNLNTEMTMVANTTFDADGSGSGVFTIMSTSGNNTARIDALPSTASITGNVVAQRYFNETIGNIATGVWRNFGISVNGATVAQITGAGFTINGNDLAREDETLGGSVNDRFELQSSFGSSIANNEGYTMWTRRTETPLAIGFTGTLNQGTQSMPITYTSSGTPSDDGWNLVNNPFPSAVDWDNMTRGGAISGTVSVWNTDTDTYDVWNGATGGLSNGLIASGQAFWIQTTGAGATLSIPESAKTSSAATFLRTSGEPISNQIIISLIQEEKIDKTFIHFREDATDGFDYQFDGRKLSNGIYNLSTFTQEGDTLAINSLAPIDANLEIISINITNIEEGSYTLKFNELISFADGETFELVDAFLDKKTQLEEGFEYVFNVTTDTISYGASRFTIEVTSKVVLGIETNELDKPGIKIYPNPVTHFLNLESNHKKIDSITIYDVQGKIVYNKNDNISKKINMSNMKDGTYIINIFADNQNFKYRVQKK